MVFYPNFYFCVFHFFLFYCSQEFNKSNHKLSANLFPRRQSESDEKTDANEVVIQKEINENSPSFDTNEMPSNAINTNNSDKPSRIAGLVLSRRTGFVVAHQRGTLMDIEIT